MKRKYPTLYSLDNLDNIRIWYMTQNGSKYNTTAGRQDGELVTSDWSIAEPKNVGKKNETTATKQAQLEIEAKYKKQLKTGYSESLESLKTNTYSEPLRAKKYADYKDKIDFSKDRYIVQIKFNGNRCIATKDGLFTRKGEKYLSCPHIEESLKSFFVKYPKAVLDGELFNYSLRQQLNELSSLIRKRIDISPEDVKKSKELVSFYVYDGHEFGGLIAAEPYYRRKGFINTNIYKEFEYIEAVKDYDCESKRELETIYQSFLADGHEGAMLRLASMPYEYKRSKNILKLKPTDDAEALILDIKDGDGNWSGAATIATLKWDDKIFDATFKGSYEERAEILKNKTNWINREVTFLYNDLTGLGVPNFARIDPKDCFKK